MCGQAKLRRYQPSDIRCREQTRTSKRQMGTISKTFLSFRSRLGGGRATSFTPMLWFIRNTNQSGRIDHDPLTCATNFEPKSRCVATGCLGPAQLRCSISAFGSVTSVQSFGCSAPTRPDFAESCHTTSTRDSSARPSFQAVQFVR